MAHRAGTRTAGGRAGGRTLPPPLPSTADLCSAAYAHLIPLEVRRRGADVTQLRPHKSARAANRRAACSHDALRARASRARLGRYSIPCLAEPLPHCGPIPFLLCGGASRRSRRCGPMGSRRGRFPHSQTAAKKSLGVQMVAVPSEARVASGNAPSSAAQRPPNDCGRTNASPTSVLEHARARARARAISLAQVALARQRLAQTSYANRREYTHALYARLTPPHGLEVRKPVRA